MLTSTNTRSKNNENVDVYFCSYILTFQHNNLYCCFSHAARFELPAGTLLLGSLKPTSSIAYGIITL